MTERNPRGPIGHSAERQPATRAAVYARMSSSNQRYSIVNQMKVIKHYAEKHNIQIVKVYKDEAKSGLTIDGRDALAELFMDVIFKRCAFEEILVYDVSRWGRFQDIDESAYYEFLCKKRGVRVTYCAELFVNDGTSFQAVAKSIRRAMAAEWSRERSARTTAGRLHLASLGFYPGGAAAYGMTRIAVDSNRRRRHVLERGYLRSVKTDHVLLAPGPRREVNVVRDIFRMYVEEKVSANRIAKLLNGRGTPSPAGRRWTLTTVLYILSNTIYIGKLLYNRTSTRMRQRMGRNERSRWITIDGIAKPIIDERTFARAQRLRKSRARRKTDEELLNELRTAVEQYGPLGAGELRSRLHLSSAATYASRFGSLARAYRLIDLPRGRYAVLWERALQIRQLRTQILHAIRAQASARGIGMEITGYGRYFEVDGTCAGYLDLPYSTMTFRGKPCWRVRLPEGLKADVLLIGLLAEEAAAPLEYYLMPAHAVPRFSFIIGGRKRWMERFRFPKLKLLVDALIAFAAEPRAARTGSPAVEAVRPAEPRSRGRWRRAQPGR